jgi:2-polyprenyl-3-methyl-5-hydroxy-6-metoxy-1,4-benzoquinol methylase
MIAVPPSKIIKDLIINSKTEVERARKYDEHTIHSPIPFVRYAQQSRIVKCIQYISRMLNESEKILDYGCGTGVFMSILNKIKPCSIIGYEPYMEEKYEEKSLIYSEYNDILQFASFDVITVFEVIEHLSDMQFDEFLLRADELLPRNKGTIFVSVPIEIGPVLIPKEIYRILTKRKIEYRTLEYLKAAFLGIPGERPENSPHGYGSHKGFDFRQLLGQFQSKGWDVTILGYGPLPFNWWYGNSQIFFKAVRK